MALIGFKDRFEGNIVVGLNGIRRGGAGYFRSHLYNAKTHTVRAGAVNGRGDMLGPSGKVRCRVGEVLKLALGVRTKNYRLVGLGRCTALRPITLWVGDDIAIMLAGDILSSHRIKSFARDDGFADWIEMRDFFRAEHGDGKFEGVLIEWEPLA